MTSTSLLLLYLKSIFRKLEPKKLIYRDFKNFFNQQLRTDHVKELSENDVNVRQSDSFQIMSRRLLHKFENFNYL